MDSLYIGAYWGDRVEDLNDCAARLRGYVLAVGEASDLLKVWVSRRKSPVRELSAQSSQDDVSALLAAGVNRKDFGGEAIPELGFSAGLWNGRTRDDEAASLTATCGLAAGNPNLRNSSVLSFPIDLKYGDNANMIRSVFEAAVRWWEPDWAWVGSNELRDDQGNQAPLIGPLSFFSRAHFSLDGQAAHVAGVHVEQLQLGVLVEVDPQSIKSTLEPLKNFVHSV